MQKTYRFKFVAIITLFCFLWCLPVEDARANPGVAVIGPLAVGALLVTAGVVHYYHPATLPPGLNGTTYIDTAANIGRICYAQYAQWQDQQRANIVSKLVTAKLYWTEFAKHVFDHPNDYPNLYKAVTTTSTTDATPSTAVGDYIKDSAVATGTLRVTSIEVRGGANGTYATRPSSGANPTYASNVVILYTDPWPAGSGNEGYFHTQFLFYGSAATAPLHPKSPEQAATDNVIAGAPSIGAGSQIGDIYTGEIDNLIKSNPNMVHFVDTATPDKDTDSAPPYYPPTTDVFDAASPTTPQQAALDASQAAQKALDSAATAAQQASAAAAAHPDDPTLANAAAAAQAQYDQLKAQQAAATSALQNGANTDTSTAATFTMPVLKAIDFSPLQDLKNLLSGKFPFNLADSVSAALNKLLGTGGPPVFHIPMPLINKEIVADLTLFDPLATVCRFLVAVLLTVGGVMYVIRRFI